MRVFISYARTESQSLRDVVDDLEPAGLNFAFDRQVGGGQHWWDQITSWIRDAQLFLLLASEISLHSNACAAEREYARSLTLPIIPVQIADVSNSRMLQLISIQVIGYRHRDARAGAALLAAIHSEAARHAPRPNPLPEPPPAPFGLGSRLGAALEDGDLLPADLASIIQTLRASADGHGELPPKLASDLLLNIRDQPTITAQALMEIEGIISGR